MIHRELDWQGLRRLLPWVAVAGILVVDVSFWATAIRSGFATPYYGGDFDTYRDAAARWAAGGGFYHDYQLVGPYNMWSRGHDLAPVMYPPPFLLVMLPFTVVPVALWWLIPIVGTALIVVSHRPSVPAWLIILGLVAYPSTYMMIATGNPAMWGMFAIALATRWPFFGPFVLLKPTLLPFALVGVSYRSWWLGLAVLVVVSLAFLPMWYDYALVLFGAQSSGFPPHGTNGYPTLLIPVVAWLASPARAGRSPARAPTRYRTAPDPVRSVLSR